MIDTHGGPCEATPSADLERQVMDCNIPKNEREWWAKREIESLRLGVRQIGEQWSKCQDVIDAQNILLREQAAEINRLKPSQ